MLGRDTLTKVFLQQWGKSTDDANCNFYSRIWWQYHRVSKQSALRLSDAGLDFLRNALDIRLHEIKFAESVELCPQLIIFLERYIDCPYHINPKRIIVTSERKSFELYMFSDDIRKYGYIKAMNSRK
jgi:hypothetical protein